MVPFQNPSFLPKKRTRRRSVNTSALNNVWGPLSSLDDIVDLQDFLGMKEKKVTFNKCRVNKKCVIGDVCSQVVVTLQRPTVCYPQLAYSLVVVHLLECIHSPVHIFHNTP